MNMVIINVQTILVCDSTVYKYGDYWRTDYTSLILRYMYMVIIDVLTILVCDSTVKFGDYWRTHYTSLWF